MASSKSSASATPTRKSGQSSSPSALVHRTGPVQATEPTLARDAIEALAWLDSGMPDNKVGYAPDAPKLTPEQLQQFKPASYTDTAAPGPVRHRRGKAAE